MKGEKCEEGKESEEGKKCEADEEREEASVVW